MIGFVKKALRIFAIALLVLAPFNTAAASGSGPAGKTCVISGKVSFPKGMKAKKDTYFTVVYSKDNDMNDFIAANNCTIKAGSNCENYTLSVPANSKGYISYRFDSEEYLFCYNGFYSQKGTTFLFRNAAKMRMQDKNKNNINLVFIKGRKLTGQIGIPFLYENAALNYRCSVIPIYDNGTPKNLKDDTPIYQLSTNYANFNIYKPNKKASFGVIVPDIQASYRFKYELDFGFPCNGGCPFIREGYYKKAGCVFDYDKADSISIKGTSSSSIDFTILAARKIQGKIILANGEKAPSDMGISILSDEADREEYVNIPKGASSAEYTLYFQHWNEKHIISIGFNPAYYVGDKSLVKDKSSAKLFDISKGDLNNTDIYLTGDGFQLQAD